jgi:GNAT superfamily N-acetyltransferase
MIQINLATKAQIPLLYELAEEIWYDHYPSIVSLEQIDYMLKTFYSPAMLAELMDKGQMFYLIEENEKPVGYLAVTEKATGQWFMNKFYVQSTVQGKGLGAEVLKIWEAKVNPQTLQLQVNRKNYKSINFYFKCGFRIVKVADFEIGNGFSMDDFIMEKVY